MKTKSPLTLNSSVAEQATGCRGAGSYAQYAEQRGFTHIEVLNWGSSAGDWEFLVSKDGEVWYILSQENNYPRLGFSHHIDMETPYVGSFEEVHDHFTHD